MKKPKFQEKYPLTEKQKEDLKNKYCNSDIKTADLIKEFNLDGIKPSQITLFFDDVVTETKCEYCQTFMRHKPLSRSGIQKKLFCPSCGHTIYTVSYGTCTCTGCQAKLDRRIRTFISCNKNVPKIYYDYLNTWEKIVVGGIHCYGRNEFNCITWTGYRGNYNLLPCEEDTEELIKDFIDSRFLVLSDYNTTENFIFEKNEILLRSIDGDKVYYDLWVEDAALEKLEMGIIFSSDDDSYPEQELFDIWIDINKAEAMNYLFTIFDKYRITNYDLSEVSKIIDKYVYEFSILQILNTIKYVTRQPAQDIALSENRNSARKKAYYDIINHLKNCYNWSFGKDHVLQEIPLYSYDFSMTTKYFYYKVLKQGGDGFSLTPNTNIMLFQY